MLNADIYITMEKEYSFLIVNNDNIVLMLTYISILILYY